MGYVRTPAEIETERALWQGIEWEAETIEAHFRTDPAFIRAVLPPCLDLPTEPLASASVGFWWSEQMDEFYSVAVSVKARFKQYEGWYLLTLIMDGDMPITLGREVWGEPKKRANTEDFHFPAGQFDQNPRRVVGSGSRNGVTLMEIDAVFGEDLGPREGESTILNLKAFPNADLSGIEPNPVILVAERRARYHVYAEGEGELRLFSSPQDPCGEVPIESIDRFVYTHIKRPKYRQVPHPISEEHDYLPYVLGTKFDVLPTKPLDDSIRRW